MKKIEISDADKVDEKSLDTPKSDVKKPKTTRRIDFAKKTTKSTTRSTTKSSQSTEKATKVSRATAKSVGQAAVKSAKPKTTKSTKSSKPAKQAKAEQPSPEAPAQPAKVIVEPAKFATKPPMPKPIKPVGHALLSGAENLVTAPEQPKSAPVVSVIIPVHNGARDIDTTIHSVLGQTFADFELIIVDDYSEDQTLRVISGFSSDKISVVTMSERSGMAKARNRGVELAQGRYICFLNARDMWQPDKLERQLDFMKETGAGFSYTSYVFADEDGMPFGKTAHIPTEITNATPAKVSSIWVSTVMLDLTKLSKSDIMMPPVRNAKDATWQNILKKISRAHGLNEVLAIRAYDYSAPLWKKLWRRV